MTKTLPLCLLLGLCAGLLAACAAPPQTATSTYTLLPTARRTALPSATATPLPPTETDRPPAPLPRVTNTPLPTSTPSATLPPWTPPAYNPPTAGPLALSPANAGQIEQLAVLGNGRPADVAWSPDGALLAVAAIDWVDLYNTTTWELAARYRLPAGELAFSPAGGILVITFGNTIRWLDLATGTLIREQQAGMVYISDIAYSPGGSWLALLGSPCSGCGEPFYALEVVNGVTGELMFNHTEYGGAPALAFSPDGRTLALAFDTQTTLLDADTGQSLASFAGGGSRVAYLPDGTQLLVQTETGLQTLTLATGAWAPLPGAPPADDFVLSPNGSVLALFVPVPTYERGADLMLWEIESQEFLTSTGVDSTASQVAFSPDGRQVAWPDYADAVLMLRAEDSPYAARPLAYTPFVTALTFGPTAPDSDSPSLLTGDLRGRIWQWDLVTGGQQLYSDTIEDAELAEPPSASLGRVTSLAYSANDQLLLAGYDGRVLRVTGSTTAQVRAAFLCPGLYTAAPHLDPLAGVFAVACVHEGPTQLWGLPTGAQLTGYTGGTDYLLQISGQWLRVTFPIGNEIVLRPLFGGQPITLTRPANLGDAEDFILAASPDGRWIAGNILTTATIIWDTATGQPTQILTGHVPFGGEGYARNVKALMFSPTTNLLVSAGVDDTLRLWDPATGRELQRFDITFLGEIAFSADGRYLAAENGGAIYLYGLPSP